MTNEFDDEALVAYLDGELDAEQTQQIDQQIASRAELRERVNQLRMTWDLLEELPVDPPNPRFAETTLELAALSTSEKSETLWSWLYKNSARIFVFALPLLFIGGYFSSQYAQMRADRQLLRDLPILVEFRSLNNIDSIEWLDVLVDQPDLVAAYADEGPSLVGDGDVPIELQDRRGWLGKLADTDRGRLSANLTEFAQSSASRQTELRKIVTAVYSDPKSKQKYLAALHAYDSLLKEQNMSQRASLFDMKIEERRIELAHLLSIRMANQYAKSIPSADAATFRQWAIEIQDTYNLGFNADALQSVCYEFTMNLAITEVKMADFEVLASRLSDKAQGILSGLNSSEAYVFTLIDWLEAVRVPRENTVDRAGPDKLKDLYMNLSGPKQEEIDLLGPEQAKAALRKLSKPRTGTVLQSPPES